MFHFQSMDDPVISPEAQQVFGCGLVLIVTGSHVTGSHADLHPRHHQFVGGLEIFAATTVLNSHQKENGTHIKRNRTTHIKRIVKDPSY